MAAKEGDFMDKLDAITLLYLSKHWDGSGSLRECADLFQQTRSELQAAMDNRLGESMSKGNYHL